jgi:hypothetical protein
MRRNGFQAGEERNFGQSVGIFWHDPGAGRFLAGRSQWCDGDAAPGCWFETAAVDRLSQQSGSRS